MNEMIRRSHGGRNSRRELLWSAIVLVVFVVVAGTIWGFTFGPALWALASYQPQEGDVIFQSLPRSPLVNAIEGGTRSPLSHCGIVARENGRWVVYEAYAPVGPTPLGDFVARGRDRAFLVKRLKADEQPHVPKMLASVRSLRGRPYDIRYRLDDDRAAIYCSELIYLAYQDATDGEQLGQLIALGELKWNPYEKLIERIEKAPPPLDRQMITPRDLSRAEQLETVFSYGY
ncbi:YiiX/YebB-like N1pC/P60 family cysteine hydrolase [Anatilimnocola floriformis]|uniref:YiiX/YebB-like N1pC/P60 family cysteine hydrolase n=1 Tax=Anatilimnocola floriformis TaxID=2948575 RepID=UPI0020C1F9E9|nr:YiiX/YebB-like N1pC/P60 family cysteine hydrolase [Anatilimnocola floriformis]